MNMTERLIEILKNSGADDYEITINDTKAWEFYFIRHELDQNRVRNTKEISLKVYKKSEDGSSLGFATAVIPPTASDEEIEKTVKDLVFQASLLKNRPFELTGPGESSIETEESDIKEQSYGFIKTMDEIPEDENSYLNSYEIFIERTDRRFINSRGVDISFSYPYSMVEAVVNARNEKEEIELYRLFEMGTLRKEVLNENMTEMEKMGLNRLRAVPTPKIEGYPVLFSTDDARNIYYYFIDNTDAAMVYRKLSSFEIGKSIAEEGTGDKLTLKALGRLEGSSSNFPYDEEGSPVRDMDIITDNVPVNFHGNRMFSQYMGIQDSFSLTNIRAEGGTHSEEELRSGNYIEALEFSDFQVDPITGDIFGEIRLAYVHNADGSGYYVTGGSISGNMKDNLDSMEMSCSLRQYDNMLIPRITKLYKMNIAGVE